ncbi:tripartite tricarboxylate transporter TctB family protein [Roseospira marina]|nr:tripartite tricarboxylate transporter TctB family protein [Roseospira marina]MBB4313909.1 ABC-type multidrug transport system permease subunit [Roseospira marina]MBB5087071.1 ABC-type multidrug transport system permease subunit [Roseospira marina]
MAIALMALSSVFMIMATDLPIGWVRGSGPGGGAFPFWLSAIMFVSAAFILIRELRKRLTRQQALRHFIDSVALLDIGLVVGALLITIGLMHVVGTYIALPLFLAFYLRVMGQHGWLLTAAIALITPVVVFLFFEVTLRILLPKGITEPLFYPLYAFFF